MKKSTFFGSSSRAALLGPMSPTEARMGRYMRGPDDHPTPSPSPAPSDDPFSYPDEVDDLTGVPERARPLYVKNEESGKFVYDDIGGLRSALGHEREQKKTYKSQAEQAKAYRELGKSPEEIRELLDAQASDEEKKQLEAGNFESLKAQMEENHASELSSKEDRIASLKKTIEKMMVSDHAKSILAEEDIQGNPTLLLPAIRDRVEVKENDEGDFELVVKNAKGQPMLNPSNEKATLRDLALELRGNAEYAGAFKGVNQSGGGAPNKTGGGAPNNLKRSEMSTKEKVAYINKHGQEAYNNLPL